MPENVYTRLRKHHAKKDVIELQTYFDTESTVLGFVHQVNDEFVSIIEVDEDGSYDGVIVFRWDTIFFIRSCNSELELITRLSLERGEVNSIKKLNITSFQNAIADINKTVGYVVLYLERLEKKYCYVAEVLEMGEFILLSEYTLLDEPMRSEILVRMSDVTRVGYGGKYEEDLLKQFQDK